MGTRDPPRRRNKLALTIYAIVAAVIIVTASTASIRAAASGEDLRSNLTLIAPAGVGGGWDTFAREQQSSMRSGGIVNNAQVVNIPGAGGTIGLSTFSTMEGEATNIMATGSAMIGGIALNDSPVTMDDVELLARITQDYSAIVVPADSPYQTFEDLMTAYQEDQDSVVWTGGSAGSIDHLLIAQMTIYQELDAAEMTYIPRSGSGEAIQTILSETAGAAAVGYNEVADQIEAGRIRALAVSSPERLEGADVATMTEQGYDIVLENWRGWVAPQGITEEERTELLAIISETRESPEWQEALARNQWIDAYLTGPELEEFVRMDTERTENLVEELDL